MSTSEKIRVRFAPSPTGYLHVGGARTALFNYLFARRQGGTFILRIEDTDLQRSSDEATQAIFDGLAWLGINHDEGPYFQTRRFDLYRAYAQRLLQAGHAYPCYCTPSELESVRQQQQADGKKPQYNHKHRPVAPTPQDDRLPQAGDQQPYVIRLRIPTEGEIAFEDLILGNICVQNVELDDFIILRSDGTPTYNFTVVVDDIDMRISHVIRGMDHVSNTPKQIAIYQALQTPVPKFAHVPMILGADKKKLSKRHGATSVIDYKLEGYLPDAFINYIARLGWSHGDQEIFSRTELEQCFDLAHVGKSPAVFDFDKLAWVNSEHIKTVDLHTLVEGVSFFIDPKIVSTRELDQDCGFVQLLESLRPRAKSLKEMAEGCRWYFAEDDHLIYDEKSKNEQLNSVTAPLLTDLLCSLEALPENSFTEPAIEQAFKSAIEKHGVKLVKLAQPVRVALTGSTVSPPIYTVVEALGRNRSLVRLRRALSVATGSS